MRSFVLTAVVGFGCYAPQIVTDVPCGEGEVCPRGQVCSQGRCRTTAVDVPDAPDDGPSIDGPADTPPDAPIDAPPVPPMMKFGGRTGAIAGTLADTFLSSGQPANNFGSHNDLHLTSDPGAPILIRVDVSMVPAHATVTSARLKLHVQTDSIPSGTKVRIFEVNESWTEGNVDSVPGIANHTHRHTNVMWSAAGALPPSRDASPVAIVTASSDIAIGSDITLELPTDVVASWVSSPTTNHGLAMFVDGTGFYCELAATEAPQSAARPVLELSLQ